MKAANKGSMQGKVAVVTGAARGIGRAAAVAFAREGANVGGIQGFKPLLEMDDADWQSQIDTNLTGTANVIRACAGAH